MANIITRCKKEGWTNRDGELLTPKTVTLYDADTYVIRPFNVNSQLSFVTCLPSTAGAQPPRFFINHWWGEFVMEFIHCLEQAVRDFTRNFHGGHICSEDQRGGGMTVDTPVWVCVYANNQWNLGDNITVDPRDSGFTKALQVAQGRTITILGEESFVFTRICCIYELYLTLVDGQREEEQADVWAVYTLQPHTYKANHTNIEEAQEAVGIISSRTTVNIGATSRIAARENVFQFQLISQSMGIKVKEAKASQDNDRVHILTQSSAARVMVSMIHPSLPHAGTMMLTLPLKRPSH